MKPTLQNPDYWAKTDEELRYIQRDAYEASRCMQDVNPTAHGKYLDQLNDASTVLNQRRKQ